MKKILAIVMSVAMILSCAALLVAAEPGTAAPGATAGAYAAGKADTFEPVGKIAINWDPEVSKKLDLTDGDMADWAAAGYDIITIEPENMISWVGYGDKATADKKGEGDPDPGMPAGWNISTYFVADKDYLYVGFYVTDSNFSYGDNATAYNGDAFQIAIDFGGRLMETLEGPNADVLSNPKNVFYSFCCQSDGAPIQIKRDECDDRSYVMSEANGDGVKGAAKKTETGWAAEFALAWQEMYEDYAWKAWDDDMKLYIGGEENKPLKLGVSLYYLNRDEDNGGVTWAAGTCQQLLDTNGCPTVAWTPYDNGIQLELSADNDLEFTCENIIVLGKGETEPPTVEDGVEDTDPPADETTAATAEETTAAPADEETTAAAAEDNTAAGTDAPADDQGCASVIGMSAVAVLAAAAAAVALKKKD